MGSDGKLVKICKLNLKTYNYYGNTDLSRNWFTTIISECMIIFNSGS